MRVVGRATHSQENLLRNTGSSCSVALIDSLQKILLDRLNGFVTQACIDRREAALGEARGQLIWGISKLRESRTQSEKIV